MRLQNKVTLITGAAAGIGAEIATRFAAEGAQVWIGDFDEVSGKATADRIRQAGGRARFVPLDVTQEASWLEALNGIRTAEGRLDILVNNAGISGLEGRDDNNERLSKMVRRALAASRGEAVEPDNGTMETTDDEWHKMMGVHVDGTFFCCREALKVMTAQRAGAIVNMASIMGTFGRGGGTAYCTAKAAILGFTRSLAHEVADRNIRVNAIAPGWILTDMTSPFEAMHPMLAAQTPMGRIGDPDDIAWAAVYLASEEATFMTGQVISPNGGWYMSQ